MQRIEYIETTSLNGTAYINTGYVFTANTKIVLDCYIPTPTTRTATVFGVRSSNYSSAAYWMLGARWWNNNYFYLFRSGESQNYRGTGIYNARATITCDGSSYTWDDGTNVYTYSSGTTQGAGTYPIYIFTLNEDNGTRYVSECMCYMKLYSFRIYEGSTLTMELLPVLDNNNVPCLYDTVGGSYYYKQGNGSFTPGPALSDNYSVEFNDGSGDTVIQNIEVGVATALETPFSKRNYRLLGWDTSSAGTTVVYTVGQTVTDIAQAGQTINLYAVWRKAWAYIIKDNAGNYYSAMQSGMTQTLTQLTGITTLTAAVFYERGFQFIPNSTILKTLTNPKVYLWADDALPDLAAEVEAIPYPQEIMTEVDLSPAYITGLKEFDVTYTGDVMVGYTYDGTTPLTTMTVAAFLALDPDDIYDGLTSAKKLYIYFYLEDEDAVLTRLTVHYKRRTFH